ncbi:MAG TPA: hypothetical protein VLJ57_01670 [Burkholderiaceae bacterium]|nr:hypothetical protein [Burkholderiaceae bacterium]
MVVGRAHGVFDTLETAGFYRNFPRPRRPDLLGYDQRRNEFLATVQWSGAAAQLILIVLKDTDFVHGRHFPNESSQYALFRPEAGFTKGGKTTIAATLAPKVEEAI